MQPLKILTNKEKGTLLHELFSGQIAEIINYIEENALAIIIDEEHLIANWSEYLFTAEFWITQARETAELISEYKEELERDSFVFSSKLFCNYNTYFVISCLIAFCKKESERNSHLSKAVSLLFDKKGCFLNLNAAVQSITS